MNFALIPKGIEMKMTRSEQLLYSTIMIVTFREGHMTGSGTGFVFLYDSDGISYPALITNKHVIEGADRAKVKITMGASDNGANVPTTDWQLVSFDLNEHTVVNHPDEDVDLCAIKLAPIYQWASEKQQRIFMTTIEPRHIPTEIGRAHV